MFDKRFVVDKKLYLMIFVLVVLAGFGTSLLGQRSSGNNTPERTQVAVVHPDHSSRAISLTSAATAMGQPEEVITLPVGHSSVIKAPWLVKQVSVADPEIADVQVITPTQILVLGKQAGSTVLTVWNERGQSWQTTVYVNVDLAKFKTDLARFLPGSKLSLSQSRDVVVITGSLRRAEHAASLHRFMDATGIKYVDMTNLTGVQQVMIKVRVAEASRTAIRALGINAFHTNEGFFGGSTINGNTNSIDIGVPGGATAGNNLPFIFNNPTSVGSATTLFAGFPDLDLQLFLEALADNQYIRVLAEPTLVAMTGEEASFLAGGEFPIPIVQGSSAGAGSTITIEYKEFGVRLRFRPVVLGDGAIRLHVAPEVSDLSEIGAVVLDGFRIPSLLTRRAETTLEMKNGQTFAMAGLINRNITARAQKVPGLGDVPILGTLFRSVRYERGETELVVLATVSLVEPMNENTNNLPMPGDMHVQPSDWELYGQGDIQGKTPTKKNMTHVSHWLEQRGLHRLKGPGAWTSYEQRPVWAPLPSPNATPNTIPEQ